MHLNSQPSIQICLTQPKKSRSMTVRHQYSLQIVHLARLNAHRGTNKFRSRVRGGSLAN